MTHDLVCNAVQDALNPGRFFLSHGSLHIEHHPVQTLRWESFRGHLLPPSQTRQEKLLESWSVLWSDQPLLDLYFDPAEAMIFVTRSLLIYGWEPFEDQPNVISSRETQLWQRELVGRIETRGFRDQQSLEDELGCYLMLALAGTSRLPITSIESPLPAFSLGEIGYLTAAAVPESEPIRDPQVLIGFIHYRGTSSFARAKILETAIRASTAGQIDTLAQRLAEGAGEELLDLLRMVFNSVALTPYTPFVEKLIALVGHLVEVDFVTPRQAADLVSYMLRHLVRHLTAFNLEQFHNMGANYPDALALDALLADYLKQIEQHTELFSPPNAANERELREARIRRRALRQAWLIRRQYHGHLVPDAPTSPGENARVLPEPFARVPDEQIQKRSKRSRRLFDDAPDARLTTTARAVLARSIADLDSPAELRELGMAVFLDRPLGVFKQPGEVDRTPLVSYEAFSRAIAGRRLLELVDADLLPQSECDRITKHLNQLAVSGIPVSAYRSASRPGVVAIEDAGKASEDFVFLRTTRQSLLGLLAALDLETLRDRAPETAAWLSAARNILFIRHPETDAPAGSLLALDAAADQSDGTLRPRLELVFHQPTGAETAYAERHGIEFLRGGWRAQRFVIALEL